jgi:hypothetical protein
MMVLLAFSFISDFGEGLGLVMVTLGLLSFRDESFFRRFVFFLAVFSVSSFLNSLRAQWSWMRGQYSSLQSLRTKCWQCPFGSRRISLWVGACSFAFRGGATSVSGASGVSNNCATSVGTLTSSSEASLLASVARLWAFFAASASAFFFLRASARRRESWTYLQEPPFLDRGKARPVLYW